MAAELATGRRRMEREATSLAGGAPFPEVFPLHPETGAAGERDILHKVRGKAVAPEAEGAVLQLLAKTLMKLATVAGTAARSGGNHLRVAPSPTHDAASIVAADRVAARAEKRWVHDAAGDPLLDGPATILVIDVDHAAATTEQEAERWTHMVQDASVREQVAAHGGSEIDGPGTLFAAAFPSARRALLCAIGVQRSLAGRAAELPAEPMRARIALHTAAVVPTGEDRFAGMDLIAAGIASRARGGDILVSAPVKALAGSDLFFGPCRTIEIEGCMCTVYDAGWAGQIAAPDTRDGVFRLEGESWTIAWRRSRCLVRDVRGLHYIAQLLRHPGRALHVLDLVAGNVSGPARMARGNGVSTLDEQVRMAYRRALDDLRDDLEEAERLSDLGRAAWARAGHEAITEELAAAVGLDGRDSAAAAGAERARTTVAQGVRIALKRIRSGLPALADELRLRIKTGMYCVYLPDPAHPTEWAR